jgi:riboflavin biosynthesis pyrimidine reductase
MPALPPSDRLRQFIARKTAAASAATLPPYRTVFAGDSESLVKIGNDWTRGVFDGHFLLSPVPHDVPDASLVFVQSKDGKTVATDPSSLGGGDTDKHVIYEGLSRVAADAIMAGAGTIGGDDLIFSVWHPQLVALRQHLGKPRHPVQIVATLRGLDLDHRLLFNVPQLRVVMITVESAVESMRNKLQARPWISAIVMNGPTDLRSAFGQLRQNGIERVSVVGGRMLARQMIDAGLIQDLYLTTSAKDGGEPNTPLYPGPLDGEVVLRKEGTGPETGVVFEHLRLDVGRLVRSVRL